MHEDVGRYYRFERPHPDAVWCDDCLRWETGEGKFAPVDKPRIARALRRIASWLYWLGGWIEQRADHAQVRYNKQRGVYDMRAPELPSRKVA